MGLFVTKYGQASWDYTEREYWVSDMFLRHMKMLLLVFSVSSTASIAWLVVLQIKDSLFDTVSLYIAYVLTEVFIVGCVPLFFELGCETSYPTAEGVTVGILTSMNNIIGAVFLSVLQIPNIGVVWMNWTLLGTVAVSVPLLLIFEVKYTRTDIDTSADMIIPPPSKAQKKPKD